MTSWEWSIESLKRWFIAKKDNPDIFDVHNEKTIVWVFTKNNDWMKYGNNGRLKKFLMHPLQTIRYNKELSEKHNNQNKLGIYMAYNKEKGNLQWLLLITPMKYKSFEQYTYANHFSLPWKPGDTVVNLHWTKYTPESDTNGTTGNVTRIFEQIPTPCLLPNTSLFSTFGAQTQSMLNDVFNYAKSYSENESRGGKNRTIRVSAQKEPVHLGKKIENIWDNHEFNHLIIVGVRTDKGMDITVTPYTRRDEAKLRISALPGLFIRVTHNECTTFHIVKHIRKWLKNLGNPIRGDELLSPFASDGSDSDSDENKQNVGGFRVFLS